MKRFCALLPLLLVFGCRPGAATTPGPDATTPPNTASRPAPPSSASGPTDTASGNAAVPAPPSAEVGSSLAASSNAFATDLYARLREQPGNLAVAPGSITLALAMTWAGARGDTATEMGKVLHFGASQSAVVDSASRQLAAWRDPGNNGVSLHVANRLFGEKSYSFDPAYIKLTDDAFKASLAPMDFRHAPEAGRQHINGWVAGETQDRIKDLIPPRAIDPDTRLVLVNAIYFLGDWMTPFAKERTQRMPFFATPASSREVPMMNQMARFKYAAADGVKVLELPYRGNGLAMTFVLPDDKGGLGAVEQSLTSEKLAAWVSAMKQQQVQVTLPVFEIEQSASLSLRPVLESMGMKLAFDRGKADFTGIANPPLPADRLFIGAVFHKAFVKVNEKGTEAAAATAVVMPRAGGKPNMDQPMEFRADHPFLFFLRDVRSGMILFMGRVSEPKS